MKFSIVKNDKTTYWDEVWLSVITIFSLIGGILLIVFRPSFWIVTSGFSMGIGIAAVIFAVMFIPCIVFRLKENHIEDSEETVKKKLKRYK